MFETDSHVGVSIETCHEEDCIILEYT